MPSPKSDAVRARMEGQKTKDTAAELSLRRALHRAGLRYRLQVRVPGASRRTIDIAFTKARLAVFVDGCFWHGCPEHYVPPKNNPEWWEKKITTNRIRDADTDDRLRSEGWRVLRLWEHENPADALARIRGVLEQRPRGQQRC